MSFLDEIRKKKEGLSHTETLVRDADGTVFVEDVQSGSRAFQSVSIGYVVDTKPDLSVAKVLPGLLMGSQDVTQCQNVLEEYNVSHILSLGVNVPKLEGYDYTFLSILDLPESCLTDIFHECFTVIDSVRKKNKTIYVHCNAGVSRSASVVIAYLMKESNLKFKDAHKYLKTIRPCIKPNEGFVKQLLFYEQHLKL